MLNHMDQGGDYTFALRGAHQNDVRQAMAEC